MSKPGLTAAFVERILAISAATLPEQSLKVAKQVVIDTVGVTLAGATRAPDVAAILLDYARGQGGNPQASVVSGGFKTSMQNAAFVNGTLANVLEFDAAWAPPNHPASPTVPAILAIAEHRALSGLDVLEAVVVAFEVQARVRLAGTGLSGRFHKPGTTGLFGAAAAAAKLFRLNPQQAAIALGIAGSRAGSLTVQGGTMIKPTHAGHAARMGVECAMLAQLGCTATADIFGPKGYFESFMTEAKPELLLEGFGSPFRMVSPGVGFKAYPCIYLTHRAIDAALELRREFGVKPEQIESVQILQPPLGVDRPAPKDVLDAKHSTQYATVVALLDGEVGIDSFSEARLQAADVQTLLAKVEYKADASIPDSLEDMSSTVTVALKDGKRMSKRVEKLSGWPGNPLTATQQRSKFLSCAQPLLSKSDGERLLESLEGIEGLANMGEVMGIVRGKSRTA